MLTFLQLMLGWNANISVNKEKINNQDVISYSMHRFITEKKSRLDITTIKIQINIMYININYI